MILILRPLILIEVSKYNMYKLLSYFILINQGVFLNSLLLEIIKHRLPTQIENMNDDLSHSSS